MTVKKYMRAVWCAVVAVLLAVSAAISAFAIDMEKSNTITLKSLPAQTEFHIYRVADTSNDASVFTAVGDFAKYPVELNGLDAEGWRTSANALAGYVLADEIPSLMDGKAEVGEELTFGGLKAGLYLVMGDTVHNNSEIIRFTPFLVHLPTIDENGEWSYSQTVTPKYETEPVKETTNVNVKKVWKDTGKENKRPKSITVQLLKDGEKYDSQTLNEKNNWSYKWKDLDADAEWTVTEKNVPNGYKVQITKEGKTWVVVNTHTSLINGDDDDDNPGTDDGGNNPGTDDGGDNPDTGGNKKPDNDLPKTGQLWWPVPIMLVVGLGLIYLGVSKGNKNEK